MNNLKDEKKYSEISSVFRKEIDTLNLNCFKTNSAINRYFNVKKQRSMLKL